jgi:hypothetical protein
MTDKELNKLDQALESQLPLEITRADLRWLVNIAKNQPRYVGLVPGTGEMEKHGA